MVLKLQLAQIPPRVGLSLEFAVAVMLIVLGLLTLAGDDRRVAESTARPITIGFVHGLAGSAAVATLPQVALIPDPVWAVGYLAVFGIGTIAGMMLVTASIAAPSLIAVKRFAGMNRTLRIASGMASIGVRAAASCTASASWTACSPRRRTGRRSDARCAIARGPRATRH